METIIPPTTTHIPFIQQLTINTLIKMTESLEATRLRAEHKDEKNECSFHKFLFIDV